MARKPKKEKTVPKIELDDISVAQINDILNMDQTLKARTKTMKEELAESKKTLARRLNTSPAHVNSLLKMAAECKEAPENLEGYQSIVTGVGKVLENDTN